MVNLSDIEILIKWIKSGYRWIQENLNKNTVSCYTCYGSGKKKCPAKLCKNGYWSIAYNSSGRAKPKIISEGTNHVIFIPFITFNNDGIGGEAKVKVKATNELTGKEAGTWSRDITVKGFEQVKIESIEVPLNNTALVENEEPKEDHFRFDYSLEPLTKKECDLCKASGFIDCDCTKSKNS